MMSLLDFKYPLSVSPGDTYLLALILDAKLCYKVNSACFLRMVNIKIYWETNDVIGMDHLVLFVK